MVFSKIQKLITTYIYRNLTRLDIHRITFHQLRHSHVTFLMYHDVDIAYISKRLGHSNIQVTLNNYAHMVKEKEAEQKVYLDSLFN
ncbi:tyrosine-type recombinase/integrase [Weissella cibaria]|uniref:tyrosine-type recombinase/integrase n=1 Tax=Weissella cibaria TaxID=137591 RepID=UPI001194C686|nr:tyrosine-type recombinase/integrase [Weissella cibaria]TVV24630.1 tyrosine-type recombinase/integrase [Weissella cibaria]